MGAALWSPSFVYGTAAGSPGILEVSGRPVVAAIVGARVERVAFAFSMRSAGALTDSAANNVATLALRDGSEIDLDAAEWHAIAVVYVANVVGAVASQSARRRSPEP